MRNDQFKTIDGVKYHCTQLPALEANSVLIYLSDTLGRTVITGLIHQDEGNGVDMAMAHLFMKLTPEQANACLVKVLASVRSEGVADFNIDTINAHFRGKVYSMYKVFAWALTVNYADFLDVTLGSATVREHLQGMAQQGKAAVHLMQTPTSGEQSTTEAH